MPATMSSFLDTPKKYSFQLLWGRRIEGGLVKVRRGLCVVQSLLLSLREFLGLNSGQQTCLVSAIPVGPFSCPVLVFQLPTWPNLELQVSAEEFFRSGWPVGMFVGIVLIVNWCRRAQPIVAHCRWHHSLVLNPGLLKRREGPSWALSRQRGCVCFSLILTLDVVWPALSGSCHCGSLQW